METKFKVGDKVVRLGSSKDYTTGRTGEVVEINTPVGQWPLRYRVKWLYDKYGKKVFFGTTEPKKWNGVRTWVQERFIKLAS